MQLVRGTEEREAVARILGKDLLWVLSASDFNTVMSMDRGPQHGAAANSRPNLYLSRLWLKKGNKIALLIWRYLI